MTMTRKMICSDIMFKTQDDMKNLTAYLSTLDDVTEPRSATLPGGKAILAKGKPKAKTKTTKVAKAAVRETLPGASVSEIEILQTVAKMELGKDVSRDEAIVGMRNKAVELNMRLVGEQHVSKALEQRGEKTPYLAIFQFCNLSDAKAIVQDNPPLCSLYALPCCDGRRHKWQDLADDAQSRYSRRQYAGYQKTSSRR